MKYLVSALALAAMTTPAFANEIEDIRVFDHNKVIYKQIPIVETLCRDVKKPVYETVQKQGNAAEGALLGMIIGGLAGKAVSGKDDGAAVGAIMGGLVGADKGAKPKTQQRVVGYEIVEQCDQVTTTDYQEIEVYSHSTIRFYLNGKRYVLEFLK